MIHSRAYAALSFGIGLVSVALQPTLAAAPNGYGLVWNDEFSGAALDTSKWTVRSGAGRDDIYTANAVTVAGGVMTIKTYTDGGVHYNGWIDTGPLYTGNGQAKFLSKKGYYEARINFHTTPGMWSAFWLQSPGMHPYSGVKDPAVNGTEIDIQEHRANDGNVNDVHSALHWGGYEADHSTVNHHEGMGSAMGNDQWHTLAVLWTDSSYTFYLDDTPYWTTSSAVSNALEYIILSSEVEDNSWAGDIPAGGYGTLATSVTNMQVDYVRLYQPVPEPAMGAGLLTLGLTILPRRRSL
jgi:beta-glucanase (GH16 family)